MAHEIKLSGPDLEAGIAASELAGDIARYPELHLGAAMRIEHWAIAQRQGQAVAADMLGLGKAFSAVPFFWSRHYDVSISYVGHASRECSIEVLGDLQQRDATVIFRHVGQTPGLRHGRITAVATVGRDQQSLAVEAAFERNDEAAVEALVRPPSSQMFKESQ